jgi:DNA-directed RNA polymerase subunit beta
MEVDHKDIVYIRIDRRRKFPVTLLFKAFGYTTEDLLSYFYETEIIIVKGKRYFKEFNEAFLKGKRASKEVRDPKGGDVIVRKGRVFTIKAIKRLKSINTKLIPINVEEIIDRAFANTIVDPNNDEPIVKVAETIDEEVLTKLSDAGIDEFDLLYVDAASNSDSIRKTLLLDKVETKEEALIEIYRRLRPGNPATPEVAQDFVDNLWVSWMILTTWATAGFARWASCSKINTASGWSEWSEQLKSA